MHLGILLHDGQKQPQPDSYYLPSNDQADIDIFF